MQKPAFVSALERFFFFFVGGWGGGGVFWKKPAWTNDCWILICIVVPKLRWMTPTFLCQLKQSVGVRDSRSPPPMWERGGGWKELEEADGWEITNQQLQLATGCTSSAYAHAWFISITLPECKNITFSLQMLIYDKQLIWETSELGSIKDPLTFTSFCLRSACTRGPSHVPRVRTCLDSVALAAAGSYLPEQVGFQQLPKLLLSNNPLPIIKWVYSQSRQTKYKSARLWQHLHSIQPSVFPVWTFSETSLRLMAPPSIDSDADENHCVFYRLYKAFVPVQLILQPPLMFKSGFANARVCFQARRIISSQLGSRSQRRSPVSGTPHPCRLCPKPGRPPLRPRPADTSQELGADQDRQTLHTKLSGANAVWPKVTF